MIDYDVKSPGRYLGFETEPWSRNNTSGGLRYSYFKTDSEFLVQIETPGVREEQQEVSGDRSRHSTVSQTKRPSWGHRRSSQPYH